MTIKSSHTKRAEMKDDYLKKKLLQKYLNAKNFKPNSTQLLKVKPKWCSLVTFEGEIL